MIVYKALHAILFWWLIVYINICNIIPTCLFECQFNLFYLIYGAYNISQMLSKKVLDEWKIDFAISNCNKQNPKALNLPMIIRSIFVYGQPHLPKCGGECYLREQGRRNPQKTTKRRYLHVSYFILAQVPWIIG